MTRRLFTVAEIIKLASARYLEGKRKEPVSGFCIDSRKAAEGLLFVPLAGEQTDGHNFLEQAIRGACPAFLCSAKFYAGHSGKVDRLARECAGAFIVDDTLEAMQQLAAGHVARFPYLKKIGITGSNGKTTTRRLVAAVLSGSARTVQTEGNLNSEIGLPMSVLSIRNDDEYAVFEMGINHPGEMKALAGIFRPRYGVFTNIGTAHTGLLGNRDNIAAEKREMLSFSAEKPVVFVSEHEEYAGFLSENSDVVFFGPESQGLADCRDLGIDGFEFAWKGQRVRLALAGRHNLNNALSALAVAEYFGISPAEAAQALSEVGPMFGRTEIIRGDFTIIQDCYNANPESMRAALDFVESLDTKGRKIVVLGEMKELGDMSAQAHRQVAGMAAGRGFDRLLFFGSAFAESTADNVYTDIDALADELQGMVKKGDLLFLKGSRGVALERISITLKRRYSLC
ncbi:MAG: UDP-N-acetylmuramoyl-tripeptide--D-alanyl-D-alanine ligase [Spirochaetales bacterium]|nr:UDP-N-acetylmuramoyl-tripeptide--D-alanyl-D-alanine ligase [Spirochaetales bacterium]